MAILKRDVELRVGYVDTDQMGIVHHSNYVRYFEVARCELMRQLGMSYAEMESRGVMMPILEVYSKYHASAYYDDLLRIEVSLEELPMARITFYYKVYNSDGKLLNSGSTVLGFLDSQTRRVVRAPFWFVELLKSQSAE